MDNLNNENIVNVFKFEQDNIIGWVYSTTTDKPYLYNYYVLYINNETPTINDAINPIHILKNKTINLQKIEKDSYEYKKFLVTKKIAEKIKLFNEKKLTKK